MAGLWSSLFGRRPASRSLQAVEYKPWDDYWYQDVANVGTAVGIPVTPTVALQVGAVFACIKVISETLAALPLIVYERREDGGKDRAVDHPLYELLHESPNAWQTSVEFLDDQQGHACLHGHCFAEIIPGARGAVAELVPIRPEFVTVEQLASRRLRYHVRRPNAAVRTLTQDEVFSVRGRSLDFVTGMSTQAHARDAIALARAIEIYGSKFFANDASLGLVLEHPGQLSPKAHERLKESFRNAYVGLANAFKPKILEEGMKATRIPMAAAKDAQLTEAQQEAVITICRYFRVPPHKIQHLIHATFSNIEHQGIEFVTDTILPWVRRWEARINASLITDRRYFAEFLLTGLLRGDNAARAAYYQSRFNIGTLSINDVRRLENENPLPGAIGDRYFVQGALVPVDKVDQVDRAAARAQASPASSSHDQSVTDAASAHEPASLAAGPPAAPVRAFERLLADAAERIAKSEVREIEKRVAKAADDPARFERWCAEFYAQHVTYVQRTLQPLVEAWQAETGATLRMEDLQSRVVHGGFAWDVNAWEPWSAERAFALAAVLADAFALQAVPARPLPTPAGGGIALDAAALQALLAGHSGARGGGTTVLVEAQGAVKQNLVKHFDLVRNDDGELVGLRLTETYQGGAAA